MNGAPARTVLLAFLGIVLLGGFNGTAIRLSTLELPPIFGAAIRFGLAAVIFVALVGIRRVPLPRGRAWAGSFIYGALGIAVVFALAYWAMPQTGAGTAQIVLALVPLLTLVLAVAQRLERFRSMSVVGSLVAVAGIAVVFLERAGGQQISIALAVVLVAALAVAESNVALKRFPHGHPIASNAVAMTLATVLLLAASFVAGESWTLPQRAETLFSVGYLVVVGTVVVFSLYLYIIERWTASATSYSFLLMPLPALLFAAIVLDEPLTPALVLGGALVLAGVYLGAFSPTIKLPLPGLVRRPVPATADGPPELLTPNCP